MKILPEEFQRPPREPTFWAKILAGAKAQVLSIRFVGPEGRIRTKFMVVACVLVLITIAAFNESVAANLSKLGGLLGGGIRALFGGM